MEGWFKRRMQATGHTYRRLERIWSSERQFVRRMLIGLTRDIDLADDLLQETYLKARDGIAGYRGDNDRAWLSTIARNLFLSHIRHRYVSAEIIDDNPADTAHYSPVGRSDHVELIRVRHAISELPSDLRTALLLKHYLGFTYREIAQDTHCPVGTAKWRVSLAVSRLKEALGVPEEPMEMTCADLNRIRILDYLYGTLADDESEAVTRHLRDCARCGPRVDGTRRILSALDALEGEWNTMHIVELNDEGVPTLYGVFRHRNDSERPSDEYDFCSMRDAELVYLSAQREELAFSKEENDDPRYANTYAYHVRLPQPIEPGGTCDIMSIYHPPRSRAAVKGEDGEWTFRWGHLTSVEHEWAFALAIRLPSGASLVSADPTPMETRDCAMTTLLWRSIRPADQQFNCEIKYHF